jgi:hypothetical protein
VKALTASRTPRDARIIQLSIPKTKKRNKDFNDLIDLKDFFKPLAIKMAKTPLEAA